MCKSFEISLFEGEIGGEIGGEISSEISVENCEKISEKLAPVIDEILRFTAGKSSAIISLNGDLAAGKTTLVRALCERFATAQAASPTYLKMLEYVMRADAELAGFCRLCHYDFYACSAALEMELFEQFFSPGLHVAEWLSEDATRRLKAYGIEVLEIFISQIEQGRRYEIR